MSAGIGILLSFLVGICFGGFHLLPNPMSIMITNSNMFDFKSTCLARKTILSSSLDSFAGAELEGFHGCHGGQRRDRLVYGAREGERNPEGHRVHCFRYGWCQKQPHEEKATLEGTA